MKLTDILTNELKEISLSIKELAELNSVAKDVILKLKKVGLKAFIGGSFAKGTVIRKKVQDIDIFIVFESPVLMKQFYSKVKKAKLGGKLKLVHGSRDYFRVEFSNIVVELIPTIFVRKPEEARNVTDVSLFHVDYVRKVARKNKLICDEIRLAKIFCQANNCYGAESYIRGFSGYSLEVLVIYFGGFINFLKKIEKRKVIDPNNYFRSEKEVMFEINSSKLQSPLIVVDPTYKYRNICAGLGLETYEKFLKVSREFLKKPSLDFFKKREVDVTLLKSFSDKNKSKLYKVDILTDRQVGDIAGTKCKKFLDFFEKELMRSGQEVLRKEFVYDGKGKSAVGYLVIKTKPIAEFRGPLVSMKEEVILYQKKNSDTFLKKGCIWSRKKIDINVVFKKSNKVKDEMGVWGERITLV